MSTFSKLTKRGCVQIGKRLQTLFLSVLFDKSIFSAKDAMQMHQKDDTKEKEFIAANTRPHRHAIAPSEADSLATSKKRENSAATEPVAKRPAAVRQVMYTKGKDVPSIILLPRCLNWSCAKH